MCPGVQFAIFPPQPFGNRRVYEANRKSPATEFNLKWVTFEEYPSKLKELKGHLVEAKFTFLYQKYAQYVGRYIIHDAGGIDPHVVVSS